MNSSFYGNYAAQQKKLTNQAIYQVRQHYFEHSQYLPYEKNYAILKTSENYRLLNSNMAQQILKEVDGAFKSFFGLLKLASRGSSKIKLLKRESKDSPEAPTSNFFKIKWRVIHMGVD